MAATTAAQKVHVEVPGFQAFGEFHGSNKDCSADAELMARHPLDGSPLDAGTLNLWWGEYWNTGHHTSGGATLDHIYWHLTGSAHKLDPTKARVAKYIGTDKIPLAQLRAEIIAALARGQTVITYLGKALALPDNEHGVYGHFVALGGVDSDLGYLVGNGDTTDALGGHGIIPTHWHGWNELAAAEINGMIALEKVTVANVSGIPTGWKDDGKTLVAPNGVPVVMGFREYVLAHSGENSWDANNWPLAGEQVISSGSIEPGNASIGPGSRQDFRLTSLGWTEARNVYVIYVGQDIRALEQQLAAANAHVAQLEQQIANQPAPVPTTPPDPKATEALNALVELAKALTLVQG
ncbi:MAG TPA: hypothetical protein VH591_08305 [Ktedonobacterales bacterium]|jgi:hypothetical protein